MPHIHTQPGQHDITVSGYIVRQEAGQWRCLVHLHKKMDVLLQAGGHVELHESPWQAIAHELAEETGYQLAELEVLQWSADRTAQFGSVQHPAPFTMNTHAVGEDHYHSDLCYGFVAKSLPAHPVAANESADLRWLTAAEMQSAVLSKTLLADTADIYEYLIRHIKRMVPIPATDFSLDEPSLTVATYKRSTGQ